MGDDAGGSRGGNNFDDYMLYSPQEIADMAGGSLIEAISPGGDLFFPALLAFISAAIVLFFRR